MSQPGRCVFCFLHAILLVCALDAQQAPKQPASGKSPASARESVPPGRTGTIDPGALTNGVFRNPSFGFSYKLSFGWVERTREMSNPADDAAQAMTLLAAFERPPEAKGDTVNSAVVIAAEAASRYPGLQNAEHYFGPLTELIKSKEFTVVNPPYDFSVGTKQLVRGDFSKDLGKLTMHQSTLVMMAKGYVVSFTFIGGTEDEVDGLIERLSFGPKQAPAPRK
jgi:hypothetical protein